MNPGFKGKCVDCGETFSIDKIYHVWMDYDPDSLEEGDEPNVYCGLHCKTCLDAAGKMCDMPVVNLDAPATIIGEVGLTATNEEEID